MSASDTDGLAAVAERPILAEWPPPFVLEGDSWGLLALARADEVRRRVPGGEPVALFGWAPVVLQATRYLAARSLADEARVVVYSEISATAFERRDGWALLPYALLVDDPTAQAMGLAYGFPKERPDGVRVLAGNWTVRAFGGEGRILTAARGLGAVLLVLKRRWLARHVFQVHLPLRSTRTEMAFQGVRRLAPAVGTANRAMKRWAGVGAVLPLGAAVQGFSFVLGEPRAD